MNDTYTTIRVSGTGEYIEKKSKFIGEVHFAKTLPEAEAFLQAARKRYYDARHHCFACITGEPDTPSEILRSNDDGEPGGTAGKPMLEVLTGAGLHYTAAVVTRYFGGTLLGTGGLVRAYSQAVAGKLQYIYARENLPAPEMEYGQDVLLSVLMPAGEAEKIKKATVQATDGKAELILSRELEYRLVGGKVEKETL